MAVEPRVERFRGTVTTGTTTSFTYPLGTGILTYLTVEVASGPDPPILVDVSAIDQHDRGLKIVGGYIRGLGVLNQVDGLRWDGVLTTGPDWALLIRVRNDTGQDVSFAAEWRLE